MDVKTYERIGRLIREIKSDVRTIERYKKEIDKYLDELKSLTGNPNLTLSEITDSMNEEETL